MKDRLSRMVRADLVVTKTWMNTPSILTKMSRLGALGLGKSASSICGPLLMMIAAELRLARRAELWKTLGKEHAAEVVAGAEGQTAVDQAADIVHSPGERRTRMNHLASIDQDLTGGRSASGIHSLYQ